MNQYVGLDVSQDQTSICVVNERGRVLWQGKCATAPEALAATLRIRAPQAERIGLESGPLSIWLCHALTALGLPVVCLDARHAKAALSLQLNKSDANDARGLAQIRLVPRGRGLEPGWSAGARPDHGTRPVGRPAG
jgi:transposase